MSVGCGSSFLAHPLFCCLFLIAFQVAMDVSLVAGLKAAVCNQAVQQ